MPSNRQIRRPPPTAADDAEAWLAAVLRHDAHEDARPPFELIKRLVAQVREAEREVVKLGNRVAELECGRGL